MKRTRLGLVTSVSVLLGLCAAPYSGVFGQMEVTNARVAKSSARNYIQQRVPAKALEMAERAVALDPLDAEARFILGSLYAERERLSEMHDQFEACLSLPGGARYERKGIMLAGAHDFLVHGIRYTRERLWTRYYNAGAVLLNRGDYSAASEEFIRAVGTQPKRVDAYIALARGYEGLDSTAAVLRTYRRAATCDPRAVGPRLAAGLFLLREGRPGEGLVFLDEAQELAPGDVRVALTRAEALRRTGEDGRALALVRGLLRDHGNDPDVLSLAGELYLTVGDCGQAVSTLRRAVDARPADRALLYNLANAYLGQGDADSSEAIFLRLLERDPEDTDLLYQLGQTYLMAGRLEQAIGSLEALVKLRPSWDKGWDTLCKAYVHKSVKTVGDEAREASRKAGEAMRMAQAVRVPGP